MSALRALPGCALKVNFQSMNTERVTTHANSSRPHCLRRVWAFLPCLVLTLSLLACGKSAEHEAGLTWNEAPLRVALRLDNPVFDTLRHYNWEALTLHPPKRILRIEPGEWGDSLWLLEYDNNVAAYTAFQQLSADGESVALGEAVCGDRVCFRRGRWIGALDAWSWKGSGWITRSLSLPGVPDSEGGPEIFGSMVHQGRIAGSERVLTGEFMGLASAGAVFAIQVECHGDTAWVYASPALKMDFAESLAKQMGWGVDTLRGLVRGVEVYSEISDLPPVILRFSTRGMVGVEGCFDRELTDFWLKMQARGLKNLK
jgi:hypothetical protein